MTPRIVKNLNMAIKIWSWKQLHLEKNLSNKDLHCIHVEEYYKSDILNTNLLLDDVDTITFPLTHALMDLQV